MFPPGLTTDCYVNIKLQPTSGLRCAQLVLNTGQVVATGMLAQTTEDAVRDLSVTIAQSLAAMVPTIVQAVLDSEAARTGQH